MRASMSRAKGAAEASTRGRLVLVVGAPASVVLVVLSPVDEVVGPIVVVGAWVVVVAPWVVVVRLVVVVVLGLVVLEVPAVEVVVGLVVVVVVSAVVVVESFGGARTSKAVDAQPLPVWQALIVYRPAATSGIVIPAAKFPNASAVTEPRLAQFSPPQHRSIGSSGRKALPSI
jgi:hypothetical protein